jgi:ribokinase
MARSLWSKERVTAWAVETPDHPTGAAYIYVNEVSGENAIIVVPGAAMAITAANVESWRDAIEGHRVFVTQLEQPVDVAMRALRLAKSAGVVTVFNPAPAAPIDESIYSSCDFVTPNESEAAMLTGQTVQTLSDARAAGDAFLRKGAGAALITLGEAGALLHDQHRSVHIPAFHAGPVVETAGAGDAFNGGFAAALSEGGNPLEAARFASAVAGLSVTRAGTAPSMPTKAEALALLAKSS